MKQDGSLLAFNRMGGSYWRKGYKGNRTDDIWMQDLETKKITRLTDTDQQAVPDLHAGRRTRCGATTGRSTSRPSVTGIFNIWRIAPTGGAPAQVTRHTGRRRAVSVDEPGRQDDRLRERVRDLDARRPERHADEGHDRPGVRSEDNLVTLGEHANQADGFAPSPDGDYVAVDFHGEIFIVPTDAEVGEKTQVTNSSWRTGRGRSRRRPLDRLPSRTNRRKKEIWLFDRETGQARS